MTSTTQNIAHEAEVQRQHVRLQLPISMIIRDITVEVIDWSNSGTAFNATPLKAANIALKAGDAFETKLIFDFQTFSLRVPLTCEVRHVNSDGSRIGCRFQDMNERNISIMQYLVSAYISGDLVQVGDMLDVVSRKNFTTPRKVPNAHFTAGQRTKQRMRNGLYSLLMLVITAGLLLYVGTSIYERLYVISADSATVTAANVSGQEQLIVDALVPYDRALKLARGMDVALGFPGYDRYYTGTIERVLLDDVNKTASRVFIVPSESLPQELLNAPVSVKADIF